jgi:hypothetical protein
MPRYERENRDCRRGAEQPGANLANGLNLNNKPCRSPVSGAAPTAGRSEKHARSNVWSRLWQKCTCNFPVINRRAGASRRSGHGR